LITPLILFTTCCGLSAQTVVLPASPGSSLPSAPAPAPLAKPVGDGPSQPLTLADALALAEKNNPRLHGADARLARATAATRTAKAYTNPQVEFFAGHQSALSVPTPGPPGVLQHYAISQTLEIPSERRSRLKVAELARTGSEFSQDSIKLAVVADVKQNFYDVIRRKEKITYAEQNLALVEDLRRRVEVEVRTGEKGRLELTRAEAELARAEFMVRSAQIELANSIAVLRAVIAAPPDENIDPQGTFEPPLHLLPLRELREQVLKNYPVLQQSRTDVQQAEASLEHQRALRVPRPVFYGEYEHQPDLAFWRTGVTIPLPLWDRRKGQIAESQAAIREATATRDERQLEIIAGLERAYEQYQLADQQVTSLQAGSLHEAESAVDAAQAAYHFGERGIVEVLDAQRVLQSVRDDLLNARFARQSALIDLETLGAVTPGGQP
jgi:cobalt-zinc-cadmium efflux system outer membrane protein